MKPQHNIVCVLSLLIASVLAPPLAVAVPPSDDGAPISKRKAVLNTGNRVSPYQLSVARRWPLACPALLDARNGDGHNELCGEERTPEAIERQRRLLDRWWSVRSHADLVGSFDWIERDGGHRIFFDEIEKAIKSPNSAQELKALEQKLSNRYTSDEFQDKVAVVRQYSPALKGKSIYGWDYCRYIGLCRWGVLAGYLSEEEAWQRMMPVARKLQKHFGSWRELGYNYLIGRRFWSREKATREAKEFNETYNQLLTDVSSPWVTIPWNTDLRQGPNTGGY